MDCLHTGLPIAAFLHCFANLIPITTLPIRVLIADEHPLIGVVVSHQKDITIFAFAVDGIVDVAAFDDQRPDLCLIDPETPGSDGVAAIAAIHKLDEETDADARIIVLTTFGRCPRGGRVRALEQPLPA